MRRLGLVISLAGLAGLFATSTAPVAAACDPATRALQYLATQQAADGSLGGDSEFASGATDDYVLGAVAAGYDPRLLKSSTGKSAYEYLAGRVGTPASPGSAASTPGRAGKLILAVEAGRLNPHLFGGQDLVVILETYYKPATGAFGDGSTFNQALGVLGEVASSTPVPPSALAHLAALQKSDGSWTYASDPSAAAGDTNSTAIALMALDAAGDHSRDVLALQYLKGQQNSDGGFPGYESAPAAPSDPDSDALAIQAIVAAGGNPATWTRGNATPQSNLVAMQDAGTGGFAFPPSTSPDPFTTSQVPAGLKLAPFPVKGAFADGAAVPSGYCSAAASPAAGSASTGSAAANIATPFSAGARQSWEALVLLVVAAGILLLAGVAALTRAAGSRRRV